MRAAWTAFDDVMLSCRVADVPRIRELLTAHPELIDGDASIAAERTGHGDEHEIDTQLSFACQENRLAVVTLLLELGANANVATKYGWTPLHIAAQHGHSAIADELLAHGADVDAVMFRSARVWRSLNEGYL